MPRRRMRTLPAPHILDTLAADGKFDKMHGHRSRLKDIKVFCFFSSEKKSLLFSKFRSWRSEQPCVSRPGVMA
jgi:hypothetical protein